MKLFAAIATAAAMATTAHAAVVDPGRSAEVTGSRDIADGSFELPLGAFANGQVPREDLEGAISHIAWALPAEGRTTLQLVAPLRAQLQALGYTILFECHDSGCGGFDFRYATELLPEPAMHVDLGDFHWLSATDGGDRRVGLMVSHSPWAGFVHLTSVGPATPVEPLFIASSKSAEDPIAQALSSIGMAALDDLEFPPGASELSEGPFTSLASIADWLAANPDRHLALVGHTDSRGSRDGNMALSEARAAAVREMLISDFGIDPDRLSFEGMGPDVPRAGNDTAEGRQLNRRVEVVAK